MKKLIGIILALCMLGTMASAAVTGSATASDLTAMTVTVTYEGLAADAQATLFAYKVADDATDAAIPAYVDQTTTPIVGIDQEPVDGTFTFKVAEDFRGKIAVKVGGTDIETPAAFLVAFVEASEPEVETDEITVGDVNGDGSITTADAQVLSIYVKKLTANQKTKVNTDNKANVGTKYTLADNSDEVTVGDVNGDGSITTADAQVLTIYVKKLTANQKTKVNTDNRAVIGTKYEVIVETPAN